MTGDRVLNAALAVLALVVLLVVGAAYWRSQQPILPPSTTPPSFGPMPASTAPDSPITPDLSTAVPAHLRGPR